ncbi:hypothetical protein LZ30DRAFT_709467 [Colletotrichum cereale]|nr:hypothetical protein LZ30DRAFT_709467 [Colletotrichum cereale]
MGPTPFRLLWLTLCHAQLLFCSFYFSSFLLPLPSHLSIPSSISLLFHPSFRRAVVHHSAHLTCAQPDPPSSNRPVHCIVRIRRAAQTATPCDDATP